MDIVFGQLHLLMLETELEAVPADTVSFELCIYSCLRASCVHPDRVCRLYSFIINVLLLLNVAGRFKSCYMFVTLLKAKHCRIQYSFSRVLDFYCIFSLF